MWHTGYPPSLLVDLYELTMGQVYFNRNLNDTACFEVFIREMPRDWGFFVMAGLGEAHDYLANFHFGPDELGFLEKTGLFSKSFLSYLGELKLFPELRALPEGRVFFPMEPVLEIRGPLIEVQLMESYILNILSFSIIEASLAVRYTQAAKDKAVFDFSLRRANGPAASLRAARAAQMAGFAGTSNCLAAKLFGMAPVGTMAHSFVQAHDSEAEAFGAFIQAYKDNSILIVDTYEPVEGIRTAAEAAKAYNESDGIKIKGVRIDGGDLAALSRFARKYFDDHKVPFMKIFVSGNLNEFIIRELIEADAPIDGFGAGTWFATSPFAPYLDSAYKLIEYSGKPRHKSSPGKATYPGRKAILRERNGLFEKDTVCPFGPKEDLLKTFGGPEPMSAIRKRLAVDLADLDESVKRLKDPKPYPVEFAL